MNKEDNISRGGLSGKMKGYTPEPPESVWEGISEQIGRRRSGRKLFIFLAAAAGLALAVTVGLRLVVREGAPGEEMATTGTGSFPDTSGEMREPGETSIATPGAGQQKEEATIAKAETAPGKYVSPLERKVAKVMEEVMREETAHEKTRVAALEEDMNGESERNEAYAAQPEFTIDEDEETVPPVEIVPPLQETVQDEDSLLRIIQHTPEMAEDEENQKERGKWQVGASLSPLLSYRDVASPDVTQNMIVNNSESPRITYAGGIQVSYLQSSRLTIESGISYNRMGVNIGDYSSFSGGWFSRDMLYSEHSSKVVSISNSMGTVVGNTEETYLNNYQSDGAIADYHMLEPVAMAVGDATVQGFSQSFDYLEIPLNVKFKVIDRTVDVQLVGGISTNLLVNNSISAVTEAGRVKIGEVTEVKKMNYVGNAGIGLIYDLFERFSLTVEPRFRYYLNSVNSSYLPVTRPYSFGVYTGLQYLF